MNVLAKHDSDHDHEVDETTTFDVTSELNTNHVSVGEVLGPVLNHKRKGFSKAFRQTSASTFLCPDNIPGMKILPNALPNVFMTYESIRKSRHLLIKEYELGYILLSFMAKFLSIGNN